MTTVEEVWTDWSTRDQTLKGSRKLVPFLYGNDGKFLSAKFRQNPAYLFLADFSVEEFLVLDLTDTDHEPLEFISLLDKAAVQKNYALLFALVKAYNKHGACCVFSEGTTPRDILEALQDQLGDTGIVSCFISKVDYKEMIRHGLIPCPIFNGVEDDQFRKVLRYYRDGFSDNEIAYWTGVLDPYDYLCKISIWSFVTLDYMEERMKEGNSYIATFLYPELLYSNMRPKTEMKMFRTPVSNSYASDEGVEHMLERPRLAVSRYAKGYNKIVASHYSYFSPRLLALASNLW